ncbi:MAG TPA: glycosyltransferase [Gemmatimonadales bacterium]
MTPPTASVIVCSRNRPALLQEAVESVLRGRVVPQRIVVVDQSDLPHEGLAGLGTVNGCEVYYLWDRARGVSRARNRGLEESETEVVLFTDDDVLVDPAWLEAMLASLAELGPRGVVTGRVLATSDETPGGWAPALVHDEEPATYEGRIARDVLEAGNMAAFRSTLLELGGFDPALGPGTAFPAGEDNDMGLRLLAAGCRIRYEPRAVIHHRAWRGPEEYIPLRWRYGVGQGAYYAKHMRVRDRYMLGRLARLLRRHLWLAAKRLGREPRAAGGHLAYVAGVLTGVVRWRVRRAS